MSGSWVAELQLLGAQWEAGRGTEEGLEDRVGHPTGVGDGEVAPYQGLTSCAFAPVRGGIGDGAINEGCNVGSNSAAVLKSEGVQGAVAEGGSKVPVLYLVALAAGRSMTRVKEAVFTIFGIEGRQVRTSQMMSGWEDGSAK